jgi:hypothetical protein
MLHRLRFAAPIVLTAVFATMPAIASAQVVPPFGGRIALIIPCANLSIYTIVISARNIDPYVPGPYIWMPGTATTLTPIYVPGIPPTHPDQQILGTFDVPYFCYIPPSTILWGWRMQTEGVSVL